MSYFKEQQIKKTEMNQGKRRTWYLHFVENIYLVTLEIKVRPTKKFKNFDIVSCAKRRGEVG